MDILLLGIGIALIVFGAQRKDVNGERTGGGIAMMTIGVVITVFGAVLATLGFIIGFLTGL